jgi:aminoglycoside phosphotransferase (APT) family kinase protein
MSAPTAPDALEPLASARLARRLPHLGAALDPEPMRARLQRLLLDGSGLIAEACARPRAELDGDLCSFQYPLRVRAPLGGHSELLALGVMHASADAAAAFARSALAPVAARWSPAAPAPRATGVLEGLGMAVSVFPVNAALPALVEATDPRRMAEVLGSPLAGVDLVRLRRSGGAVLLYRLEGGGDLFGKVGYAATGEQAREVLAALGDGARPVACPQVVGRCAELDLTLISRVPGRRPDLSSATELEAAVDGAARVAAALHTSGIAAGPAHTLEDELARSAVAVAAIRDDAPELAGRLTRALEQAGAAAGRTAAQPALLAHGDMTPSQLLLDGDRVGLVDFDGVCQAEPAFDLGRFLAYLRAALAKSGNPAGEALGARLLAAHAACGGPAAPRRRVEAWATASVVQMAAHRWGQLKPARLRLACALLEEQLARLI